MELKPDGQELHGACLCGAVNYRVSTDIRQVVNCHCSICRRMNGSAFSTYAVVPRKFLTVLDPTQVATFRIAPGMLKHCCRQCGTPLYNLNDIYPRHCMLYLGSLQHCTDLQPLRNIYCGSMLGWTAHVAELDCHDDAGA